MYSCLVLVSGGGVRLVMLSVVVKVLMFVMLDFCEVVVCIIVGVGCVLLVFVLGCVVLLLIGVNVLVLICVSVIV